jgi:uncharacterized repeat protein (TIGR01451 family)/fimbrial isopeptide formation D2 family protein
VHAIRLAVALLALALPGAALADGTPDIRATVTSGSALYGDPVRVTVTAANPSATYGYNLGFRVVLPAGVSYAGGAEVAPTVIANQPATGQTTLLFANVSDLSPGSSEPIAFDVSYAQATFDAGQSFPVTAQAFVDSNPRLLPKFTATGAPIATSYTGFTQPVSGAQTLDAIEVTKSEPSPEGELLRGVHDHQTVYTVTVRNNELHPTTGTVLDDYLPAGLEFLGCGGGLDHTTSAPTNPGSPDEFAGSGPIVVPAVPGCALPLSVDTENVDPDGALGPLPAAIYTHVVWQVGALAPGQTVTFPYRAAVPIRANTLTFTGPRPTAASGGQAVDLDNNSGPEVTDETALENVATAHGTYQTATPVATQSTATLTRTAEDWVVRKAASSGTLGEGAITTWTLTFQTSEYRSVQNATVTDTLPNGLCPLGATNLTSRNDAADSECAPVSGVGPSAPYSSAVEHADGTWTLTWNASQFARLAHTGVNDTFTLSFPTRTRAGYQSGFLPSTPILTRDAIENDVTTQGQGRVRCAGAAPDCTAGGTPIAHDGGDLATITDARAASQAAVSPAIAKLVASSGTDCQTARYVATVPHYHPGDRVCWLVRVSFPSAVDTAPQRLADSLPADTTYEAGSEAPLAPNNVTAPVDASGAADGLLSWTVAGGHVAAGGLIFQRVFSTIAQPAGTIVQGDVVGNLLKFSSTNTAGVSLPQRAQASFVLDTPVIGLTKGVAQVVRGSTLVDGPYGPNVDHRPIEQGDHVTFRVDVGNTGAEDATAVQVRDVLPSEFRCAAVTAISDGGTCVAGTGGGADTLRFTVAALPAGQSHELTYTATAPSVLGPGRTLTNHAGVRQFQSATNLGGSFTYTPANNIDPTDTTPANVPRADDVTDVFTRNAAVAKTRTTSIAETGNDTATQATIGETITYTVSATVPEGTTLGTAVALTDTLDSATRQPYVAGSASATLNGLALPAGFTLDTSGTTPRVVFPAGYANAAGSGDDVVRLVFSTLVADVAANTRSSASLTNLATLSWVDPVIGAQARVSPTVSTQIVEPLIAQSKTDDRNPARVLPNDVVTYTVTTSDAGTRVSAAHDVTTTDHVPAGLTPIGSAPGNVPLADGAAVPGSGGAIWHAGTRTITRTVATIAAGGSSAYSYRVLVDNPAVAGTRITNTVGATAASLPATATGRRTAGPGYTASANDTIVVAIASVAKTVTPATATIGDPLTYDVVVTLPANLALFDVTVKDVVPDDVDVDGYGAVTCLTGCPLVSPVRTYTPVVSANGTTVVAWDLGDIATALGTPQTVRLEYRAHVRATHRSGGAPVVRTQTAVNSATVSSDRTNLHGFDPAAIPATFDDTSPAATATTTVIEPQITLDKKVAVGGAAFTDGPATARSNDALRYELVVTNTGDAPAYDVQVTDLPDAELVGVTPATVAGATLTDGWTPTSPGLGWTIAGPLAPHASVTLTYTAALAPASTLHDGEPIDNTAHVPHSFGVPVATRLANPGTVYRDYLDGGTDSTRVVLDFPTLTTVKTTGATGFPDTATAEIGQDFAWRIVVANTSATATAHAVAVSDTLPPNWHYSGGAVLAPGGAQAPVVTAAAGGDVLGWTIPALAPGTSVTITYDARPVVAAATTPGLAAGAHVNSARVASATDEAGNTGDADGPYATPADTATATLVEPALTISKTPDHGPADAGSPSSFTVTVGNTGNGTARNVDIADVLPAGLSYTAGTATATPAAGFSETSVAAGPAAGQTSVHWRLATLAPGASVTLHLPVAVAASVLDGSTLTNTASAHADEEPVPVSDTGSLDVAARTDLAIDKTGAPTYTAGSEYTWHLRVRNLGPADARNAIVSDTLPGGTTLVSADAPCVLTTGVLSCALGTVPAGSDRTYDVLVGVDPGVVVPTLDNTATVATTTIDRDPANNSSTFGPAASPLADVSVIKTASPVAILLGHDTTFTLTVANGGPSVARAVSLVDTLPPQLAFVSTDGATCTQAGGTISCPLGDLAPGASVALHVVASGVSEGTWVNDATVSTTTPEPAGGGLPDSSSAQVDVGPVADLALVKSGPTTVGAGGQLTWSLAVANDGVDDATGVSVVDPLPAGTVFVSADPGCSAAAGVVTCAIGPLAVGASTTRALTVIAPVALAGTTVVNTATVHGDQGDDHPENDTSSASTLVGPSADLSITKTGPARVTANGTITWTLVATDGGPSPASGVTIADALPAGVTYQSATPTQGTCGASGQAVSCALGALAPGATASVQVVGRVATSLAGTTIQNTATVQGNEPDPDAANNSSTASTAVDTAPGASAAGNGAAGGGSAAGGPARRAVLRLRKTTTRRAPLETGATVTYRIRLVNTSTGVARSVTVCDRLPAPLVFVSARGARFRSGQACWSIARLAAHAARSYVIVARVIRGAHAGTVRNTAVAKAANATTRRASATVRLRTERLSHELAGGVTG